ncbi:aminotransferase class III-fold pyridoxal phosphate-dependent enzyme [Maribacter sp. 4G9]|uniref:aminotransferase class III-fold pyridoxal phosphate-dependent enzyme n=1 Tax=Maribacter sp. 4G9 TaxID=1889777 RepID=UPI000C155F3D|nr:aminotransferase class III-fold pyridoxal phosphate-dependent enzyme [Maribacter sp. 4G9]PIB39109.1 aminotransferase class III [Maribacter sp. 4G9]
MEEWQKSIAKVLQHHFDISKPSISGMEGYESRNFKIVSQENSYVLKVYEATPSNKAEIDGESNNLMQLQELHRYDFPLPLKSKNGTYWIQENDTLYRLLTYVEGEFLGDISRSKTLAHALGVFLAEIDTITIPMYDAPTMAKQTAWDLRHFYKNEKFIAYIPDPKHRSLVEYFFMQFKEKVIPQQGRLRMGIVHNDANEWNVLTRNNSISGIIDFGDMCYTWTINELAVALTYYMMEKEDPLEYAVALIKGYHSIRPLETIELDVLYYLIAARLCTSVCNSAYAKKQNPNSAYIIVSEKPAWKLLHLWLTIHPIAANNAFRKAAGFPSIPTNTLKKELELRKKFISSSLSLSYKEPIHMVRSAFQYMYDDKGNTILDAYNNIMLVGHCHPKVVEAGQRTFARLNTNTRYVYDELQSYSEKLLSKFPDSLNKIFFVNSGSAASDLAIRLAQTHTQKNKIMVMEHGYHGNTRMGVDISHYKYEHQGGTGKKEYILEAPMPKIFGSGFDTEADACTYYAGKTQSEIEKYKSEIGAFIAEPIIGCGGQVPLPKDYLRHIYPKIRAQGGVCISDEVQVGFGRLGKYFWGYQMYDVVPDIVILGKPMGNGHPIGAVITTNEIAQSFENGLEFFSSFGGNPVSCAIGEAVLDVIQEEQLDAQAQQTGSYLKDLLVDLGKRFPELADVRGEGLFLGVEITDENNQPDKKHAQYLKNGLRNNNILIGTDGPQDNVLKIKPPLYFNRDNCNMLISQMEMLLQKK